LRSVTFWAVGLLGLLGIIYYLFVHRQMQAQARKK